jgi:hypothetical protein
MRLHIEENPTMSLSSMHPLHRRPRLMTLLAFSAAIALLMAASAVLWPAASTDAHCDAVNGPVVGAAREALETGDVDLVLPFVQAEAESELIAAFEQTLDVREQGGTARELADRWFFETAVRLHREGEGAPYTGLKDDTDFGPALEAAEASLATGSLDEVQRVLDDAVRDGLGERYAAIEEARAHAEREGTVEAQRELVEAELGFELYVEGIYQSVIGDAPHGAEHQE